MSVVSKVVVWIMTSILPRSTYGLSMEVHAGVRVLNWCCLQTVSEFSNINRRGFAGLKCGGLRTFKKVISASGGAGSRLSLMKLMTNNFYALPLKVVRERALCFHTFSRS